MRKKVYHCHIIGKNVRISMAKHILLITPKGLRRGSTQETGKFNLDIKSVCMRGKIAQNNREKSMEITQKHAKLSKTSTRRECDQVFLRKYLTKYIIKVNKNSYIKITFSVNSLSQAALIAA